MHSKTKLHHGLQRGHPHYSNGLWLCLIAQLRPGLLDFEGKTLVEGRKVDSDFIDRQPRFHQKSQPRENISLDLMNNTEQIHQQVEIYLQRALCLKSKTTPGTFGFDGHRCVKLTDICCINLQRLGHFCPLLSNLLYRAERPLSVREILFFCPNDTTFS